MVNIQNSVNIQNVGRFLIYAKKNNLINKLSDLEDFVENRELYIEKLVDHLWSVNPQIHDIHSKEKFTKIVTNLMEGWFIIFANIEPNPRANRHWCKLPAIIYNKLEKLQRDIHFIRFYHLYMSMKESTPDK